MGVAVTDSIEIQLDFGDEEEPTMPYARLGYGADDVGRSEITVRKVQSGGLEVLIVRVA